MTPITSTKPYMVGPGNHEANCDNGGTIDKTNNITYTESICIPGQTNFTGYINHFRMPASESGGLGNFWYSFDYGMTHFIQLDTETDLGHGFISPDEPGGSEGENSGPFAKYMNQQTDWLAKDLAAVDRSKTPWIIVAGHRPWYISAQNDSSTLCWECKDVFEPLFLNYSVDLVLSGHVHAYQRNAPIYNSQADPAELCNPKSPWYITNGAAGHYDGLDTLITPYENFSRFAMDTVYGWSRLTFHNATHLTQEFVASGNGSVLDSATLYKEHSATKTGRQGSGASGYGGETSGHGNWGPGQGQGRNGGW
jgi:acid phosphatase type 7